MCSWRRSIFVQKMPSGTSSPFKFLAVHSLVVDTFLWRTNWMGRLGSSICSHSASCSRSSLKRPCRRRFDATFAALRTAAAPNTLMDRRHRDQSGNEFGPHDDLNCRCRSKFSGAHEAVWNKYHGNMWRFNLERILPVMQPCVWQRSNWERSLSLHFGGNYIITGLCNCFSCLKIMSLCGGFILTAVAALCWSSIE